MRSHLGCTGSIILGQLSHDTHKRLEAIAATWLEYMPESSTLEVRHVQPDDIPPMREIAGELVDFLQAVSDTERTRIPGGALIYQDEATGQLVQIKVWERGLLTISWARPDYQQVPLEAFHNQPVRLVFEPFQRLNGTVSLQGNPTAGDYLRRIIDQTAGEYSQGNYAIESSVDRVTLNLRDVNCDALTLVNALRYTARDGSLTGEIDISSFRAGDIEDYSRFSFRPDGTWMARPRLWSDMPDVSPGASLPEAA
jgi:hypothetical protein